VEGLTLKLLREILEIHRLDKNEVREIGRRYAKDPRTEIVRGSFVTLDVRK